MDTEFLKAAITITPLDSNGCRPKLILGEEGPAGVGKGRAALTKRARKTGAGARTSATAAMHRAMRQQSLKVPWREFDDACNQMILWRSFALWVRAIVSAEQSLPAWLCQHIEQRCPGLLDCQRNPADPESAWLDLSSWVDEQFFGAAREADWLDALHFYSGRDPRSEQVWGQWTRAETAWKNHPPESYPSFDEWHHDALKNRAALDNKLALAGDEPAVPVSDYIEWEAFAFWARLIVEAAGEMPDHLVSALERRCPDLVHRIPDENAGSTGFPTWLWKELLAWIEDHFFTEATSDTPIDAIRAAARAHIRGERIAAYWAHCSSEWAAAPPSPYPSFEEWLREADAFVTQ